MTSAQAQEMNLTGVVAKHWKDVAIKYTNMELNKWFQM